MSWWDGIKDGSKLDPAIERVKTSYKKLISHPDYNRDAIDGYLSFALDALENGEYSIETSIDRILEDERKGEKYGMKVRSRDEIPPMMVANLINWTHNQLEKIFRNLSTKRSLGLFESMAESMGVEIKHYDEGKPTFTHNGLDFKMRMNELMIYVGNHSIAVCIVPSNRNIPIGDYYATLLGLLVARPHELDVLDFAIKLANILKEYKDDWGEYKRTIEIFSPFERMNSENHKFESFIALLLRAEEGPARQMLEEIKGALIDCFGSTRGFIE